RASCAGAVPDRAEAGRRAQAAGARRKPGPGQGGGRAAAGAGQQAAGTGRDRAGAAPEPGGRSPYQEWAAKVGKAQYELMKLDAAIVEKDDGQEDGSLPTWLLPKLPANTAGHHQSSERDVDVKERQDSGATGPWTSRSWINANPRRGLPVVVVPQEGDDLPQATCDIAPWWDE
ncbi:hypothetical protein AB0D46_24585, partial [Streptomyces sp. NPDC048383]